MRAVICRVHHAAVVVEGATVGRIDEGLLVYVGVVQGDTEADADEMARKLPALRLFCDEHGKLNHSTADIAGGLLLIPNFTLAGRTDKGTRPSFSDAAHPDLAKPLFDRLVNACAKQVRTASGVFGAHMLIDARFHGPVTVILDT